MLSAESPVALCMRLQYKIVPCIHILLKVYMFVSLSLFLLFLPSMSTHDVCIHGVVYPNPGVQVCHRNSRFFSQSFLYDRLEVVFIVSTAIIGVHCDRFLFSFKEWFDDPGSMNFLSHKQFTCYFLHTINAIPCVWEAFSCGD